MVNFIYNLPDFRYLRNIFIHSEQNNSIPEILTEYSSTNSFIFRRLYPDSFSSYTDRVRLNEYIFNLMSHLIRFDRINYS